VLLVSFDVTAICYAIIVMPSPAERLAQHWKTRHWHHPLSSGMHDSKRVHLLRADIFNMNCRLIYNTHKRVIDLHDKYSLKLTIYHHFYT